MMAHRYDIRSAATALSAICALASFGGLACKRGANGGTSSSNAAPVQPANDLPLPRRGSSSLTRYSLEGDDVRDSATDLLWQRTVEPTPVDRASSERACASKPGFRLPSRIELLTLTELAHSPTIDPIFGAVPNAPYWTNTPVAGHPDARWTIEFVTGASSTAPVDRALVRCVKGSVREPLPQRWVAVGESAVEDKLTTFVWTRMPQSAATLDEAVKLCKSLKIGRIHGFHLPGRQELETIVDSTRSGPALDPAGFPNAAIEVVWSASEVAGQPGRTWAVSFDTGEARIVAPGEPRAVRCVKAP
jgi:hypothetical protein